MLRRKYNVQKSIRFDQKLADDLAWLADELDRSLNDVVNIACENLIRENKGYFSKLIIIDGLSNFFENGEESATFALPTVSVTVGYQLDEKTNKEIYSLKIIETDEDGNVINKYKSSHENIDDLYYELEQCAIRNIDYNSPEMRKYLKHRLDYK